MVVRLRQAFIVYNLLQNLMNMNKTTFPLKILHTADIQIEVRNQHQRADEYRSILEHLYQELKSQQSNLYFIVGDIFETCRPNDIEREIFIEHLKKAIQLPNLKEIVITHGNHDVDQRQEFNYFLNAGEKTPSPNSLDTIVKALDSDKIMLLDRSTAYRSNAYDSLVYYNWSQKTKHSGILNEHYNPLENGNIFIDNVPCKVTFYHDPIYGCTSFDGKTLPSNEKLSRLDIFKTNTIFAGDIHQPQMINDKDKVFIYPGSPCPRNYGEGDYYENGRLIQEGAVNHTFSCCLLNENGTISNQEWKQVPQYRTYATFIITNEALPSNIDKLNWCITHPGTNETFVKVKLPSASESWLMAQQSIIDLLKNTNPNLVLNISFVYGKGIVADNETTQDVDVKELISRDKIIEVAKKYIHNQVTASRSIPSEDKEKVENEINNIFLSELDNITSVKSSYVINLESMKISNFMAFGKGVNVDFTDAKGITKLTGGNGVGKTTLYKAIKWVLTGYISQNQNRTKKNENNLAVFNDYLYEEPCVEVELNIMINGQTYHIVRNVKRVWKKDVGVEEKSSKTWKQYVASTDVMLKIYDEDENLTEESNAAEVKLQTWFGGLENLERIVFADQFTLRSFVCSEPQRLCEEILNHMGLSFFDTMANNYDNIRSRKLGSIPKPSFTIEELNNKITSSNQEIGKNEETLSKYTKEIEFRVSEIKQRDIEIEELNNKKYPGITDDSLAIKKNEIATLEHDVVLAEKEVEETRSELDVYFSTHDKNELDKKQKEIEDSIQECRTNIETLNKDTAQLKISNSENERKKTERIAELKSEASEDREKLLKEISEVDAFISSIDLKISELNNKKTDILKNAHNTIDNDKLKLESQLSQVNTIKEQHEERVSECNKRIEQFKNSETCPTCGRPLDEHTIEQIQSSINEENENLEAASVVIAKCEKKIIQLQESISQCNKYASEIDEDPEQLEDYSHTHELLLKALQLKETKQKAKESLTNRMSGILNELKIRIDTDEFIKKLNDDIEKNSVLLDKKELELSEKRNAEYSLLKKLEIAKHDLVTYTDNMSKKLSISDMLNKIATDKEKLKRDILEYENDIEKLEKNTYYDKSIAELKSLREDIETGIKTVEADAEKLKILNATMQQNIDRWKNDIQDVVNYRVVESSLKQYKALLGKSGLPQYIFSIIKNSLNTKLNDLLEDLNFRLLFNEDNQLVMIDLSKPTRPMRLPSQFSGMQTCFSGLSLLYVNRMCNVSFIFDTLFIDEISGQLNSGEDLQYESLNYQEQLKTLLRKFEGLNIWIVDHVIQDMNEDHLFEVSPSSTGTQLTKLG